MTRDIGELGIHLQKIMKRLMANQNLMKLIYFNDKDPLNHDDLSKETISKEIFEKYLKIIPRVGPKETANSVVTIRVINGFGLSDNDQFKDIALGIEIFTPLTEWIIKDSNLRPFAIMGQIQKSLRDKKIDGLGKIVGGDFSLNFLTDEISCYEMIFHITEYD